MKRNTLMNTRFTSGIARSLPGVAMACAMLAAGLTPQAFANNAQEPGGQPATESQPRQSAVQFNSGERKVNLIELYTSEGCSSCPPADRWLSRLGDSAALWQRVVPVAFHVSYWDRLGWPDRFAQRKFDSRQRTLAARADAGVYTPGMFRDGAEFRSWRRTSPQSISSTIQQQPEVGNLQLRKLEGNHWQVTFSPAPNSQRRPDQVFVAVLGNGLNNDVRRGENAGKLLEHDFVVLNLKRAALHQTATADSPHSQLQASFALDTTVTARPAVAAWVVDASGSPLQAVGGELQPL